MNTSQARQESDQPRSEQALSVVIGICTYNRPKGLQRALVSLAGMHVNKSLAIEVLVIDNSADANARELVKMLAGKFPWNLNYLHESASGISFARNAALDRLRASDTNYFATIDDDMYVDPGFLTELMSVAENNAADAVISCKRFDYSGAMSWWVDGAYRQDYREPQNDIPLTQGHTGGCLIRLEFVRSKKMRFDESLGKSGGEDTLFFDQMLRNGGNIWYASKAISYEVLGAERMRMQWWLKRWYRTGNTTGLVRLSSIRYSRAGTRMITRFSVIVDGTVRIVSGFIGTLVCLPWLLCHRSTGMRSVRMLCRGSGYIAAAAGKRYDEYVKDDRGE